MHPELQVYYTDEVKLFLAKAGALGGKARKGSLALSLVARRNAPGTWRLRRARYGESGRKAKSALTVNGNGNDHTI